MIHVIGEKSMKSPNAAWRDKQREAGLKQKLIWVSDSEWVYVKNLLEKLRKLREVKS